MKEILKMISTGYLCKECINGHEFKVSIVKIYKGITKQVFVTKKMFKELTKRKLIKLYQSSEKLKYYIATKKGNKLCQPKKELFYSDNYSQIIDMISTYYYKSKSVRKTIDYIQKRFARLLPQPEKEKMTKITGKFVKCPECKQAMQIAGNRPGTMCPNCGQGELEIM